MKSKDKNQNDQPDNTTPPENHGNFTLFSHKNDPIEGEVRRQQELMNQENRLTKDSLTPDESSKKSNH